jgi:hypothetical protein
MSVRQLDVNDAMLQDQGLFKNMPNEELSLQ